MNPKWCRTYRVECDFLVGRVWLLTCESPDIAREVVSKETGVPINETEAKLI